VSGIKEWSDGVTEWWNDGNPILQDSTIPMSKERRGYAAGLPANIGTGLGVFGDHERHAHLGVGQSRVRPTRPHRGRRGQCRFIADMGRTRRRLFRPRGSAYRIDLHSRRATNHVGAGERRSTVRPDLRRCACRGGGQPRGDRGGLSGWSEAPLFSFITQQENKTPALVAEKNYTHH